MSSDFDRIFANANEPDRKGKRGRPKGKSSNPAYCQLIARVPFRLRQDFKSWLNSASTHETGILEISEAIHVLVRALMDGKIESDWLINEIMKHRDKIK
jgi:hypothetical protein